MTGSFGAQLLSCALERSAPAASLLLAGLAVVLQVVAVLGLIHGLSWRRDRGGLLDTLILATAVCPVTALLLTDPHAGAAAAGRTPALSTVTLAMGDLLVMCVLARFSSVKHCRNVAFWLLVGSILAGTVAHGALVYRDVWGGGTALVVAGLAASGVLLAGAAAHPARAGLLGSALGSVVSPLVAAAVGSAGVATPGLLLMYATVRGTPIDPRAVTIGCMITATMVVARMVDLVATVQQQSRVLREQARQLDTLAHRDALTGLPNRRAWDVRIEQRRAQAVREGVSFLVVLVDLDHFKAYNDQHGHPEGDRLLHDAAEAWAEQLRDGDFLARYGGEEFGLILAEATDEDAARVIDRLRGATPYGQTFSAGVAGWTGEPTVVELLERVDQALYQAKKTGRNRTVFSRAEAHAS
ncbi:diguanylate cyclase (GGDEF)-like protein [Actinoplanes tereljensis]|uniref:GGDEF domain-containing protein n=1 Tax=Paractinoplanes tereljensis TaxID=571912 RepID=A0A919NRK9_9ACTN|nr:diguanylate cyclase [Actinoplanes tereljensis]GIF23866.1 hypothetical protein Ate02nite_65960 [Actinoplanes tereljensis]